MKQNDTDIKLSKKQREVAEMLANPDSKTTKTDIMTQVGVSRATFYRWIKDAEFIKYVENLINKYTDAELPAVWKALLYKCAIGDTQAIKLFFELKGKYNQNVNVSGMGIVQIIDNIPQGDDDA